MQLLLDKGALPDFEDANGWTPLSRAVEEGNVAVLKLLLAKEVKMDYRYTMVSESHPYLNASLPLIADIVILDYCRG